MVAIPADRHDLFEKEAFAHFATVMPDGAPHVTPVWIDYDPEAETVLVNTAEGRQKHRNVERNPQVGVSIAPPDDPYNPLSLIGEVTEITTEGATEHIDQLAQRYQGNEQYSGDRTNRIIIEISPTRILAA